MFSSTQSTFAALVAKATSELLPTEDIALNLQVCDVIRGKKIPANQAVKVLKDRLTNKNPNVQLLTLKLLEMCVKNCGHGFHFEVAQRPFIDSLAAMVRFNVETNYDVKTKILELIQGWSKAFTGQYDLAYVSEVFNMLRNEGVIFPPLRPEASEIMLEAVTAPDWSDSDVCMRCRLQFTMVRRKHHCRNCGQTFCNTCCSKRMALPDLGIEEEERVCEGCFEQKTNPARKYGSSVSNQSLYGGSYQSPPPSSLANMYGGIYGNASATSSYSSSAYPGGYDFGGASYSTGAPNSRGTPRSDEDEDLKRALELSLKETRNTSSSSSSYSYSSPPKSSQPKPPVSDEDDPDLAAAIAASLNEVTISSAGNTQAKSSSTQPSKPATTSTTKKPNSTASSDELSATEKNSINLFSKLIYKIEQNGDSILGNRELQELHTEICALHPKLFANLEEVDEKIARLTDMNEKITEILELYNRIIEERMAFVSRRSDYAPLTTPSSHHSHSTSSSSYQPAAAYPLASQGYQPSPPTTGSPYPAGPGYQNPNASMNGTNYYPPSNASAGYSPAPPSHARPPVDQYAPPSIHNPNAAPAGGYTPSDSAGYNPPYSSGYQPPAQQYPPTQSQYPPMQNQYASPSSLLIDL